MLNIDKKTEGKTAIIEGIIVTIVMIIIAPLVPGVLDVTRPALAYGFLLFYLTVRYGREECPLLLSGISGESSYLFNLTTEPEEIIRVQEEAGTLLRDHDVDEKTINRAMLLIEEMYVFIRQMNDNKAILAECTVFLKPDGVQIITKDEGVSFDMADENNSTLSLSAYTVASYLEKRDFGNRHLTTMSFNRSSFFIQYEQ